MNQILVGTLLRDLTVENDASIMLDDGREIIADNSMRGMKGSSPQFVCGGHRGRKGSKCLVMETKPNQFRLFQVQHSPLHFPETLDLLPS